MVLIALVADRVGTLNRMLQLCTRRGWNVESCTVSLTEEADVKRITLFLDCEEDPERLAHQFLTLADILEARALDEGQHIDRELLLAKVRIGPEGGLPPALSAIGARIVWRQGDLALVEATGSHDVLDPIVATPPPGVLESAVTGRTCLEAGPGRMVLPVDAEVEASVLARRAVASPSPSL